MDGAAAARSGAAFRRVNAPGNAALLAAALNTVARRIAVLRTAAARWVVLGAAALGGLLVSAAATAAGFPAAYAPIVVQATGTPQRHEFDLTPALRRAQAEKKRLYVYLGADDCRYCRRYEALLDKHATELKPHFAKDWLVVDLRSTLSAQASKLYIRVNDATLPYADFQRSIGDERARLLVYPSVWLFDTKLKPLMQMPAGTGTFETVEEQLEILRLEQ